MWHAHTDKHTAGVGLDPRPPMWKVQFVSCFMTSLAIHHHNVTSRLCALWYIHLVATSLSHILICLFVCWLFGCLVVYLFGCFLYLCSGSIYTNCTWLRLHICFYYFHLLMSLRVFPLPGFYHCFIVSQLLHCISLGSQPFSHFPFISVKCRVSKVFWGLVIFIF